MKCPLCNSPATSPHHIKPRSEEGTDELRNIVMLCNRCHDEVEGLAFTPELIKTKRREKLGKAADKELYTYIVHPDGMTFIGVSVGDKIILPFSIFIPYDAQFTMPLAQPPKHKNLVPFISQMPKVNKRGRPCKVIPQEVSTVLNQDLTLRQKAEILGVSPQTVMRRMQMPEKEEAK